MSDDRLRDMEIEVAKLKAHLESEFKGFTMHLDRLGRDADSIESLLKTVSTVATRTEDAMTNINKTFEKHVLDDLKSAQHLTEQLNDMQRTIWKAAGGLAAVLFLLNMFGQKLLTLLAK